MKQKWQAASLVCRSDGGAAGAAIGPVGLNSVVAKGFDRASNQDSVTAVVVNVVVVNLNDTPSSPAYAVRAVGVNLRVTDSHDASTAIR